MEYDIETQVQDLEQKMRHAAWPDRLKMHPVVQKMIDQIASRGERVPLRLSRMNAELSDDAFDALHDNMPL